MKPLLYPPRLLLSPTPIRISMPSGRRVVLCPADPADPVNTPSSDAATPAAPATPATPGVPKVWTVWVPDMYLLVILRALQQDYFYPYVWSAWSYHVKSSPVRVTSLFRWAYTKEEFEFWCNSSCSTPVPASSQKDVNEFKVILTRLNLLPEGTPA